MFPATAVTPWLHGPAQALTLTTAAQVASTMTSARQALAHQPLPFALIADTQSAGVGRRGKSFFSPAGTGLYLTVAFTPPAALTLVTPAAGVALQAAIANQFGVQATIKWVNDLLVGERKVAGILAEQVLTPRAILLGVGVNVAPSRQPVAVPIDLPMGTLLPAPPAQDPRPQLAGAFLSRFFALMAAPATIMPAYRAHAAWLGARVQLTGAGAPQVGQLAGFDDQGALQLHTPTGLITASSGSIRRL
ncbi:biotin--[acetyl-CoA-carboxylase] ligase [Lacticaseibacillus daqingensis]|uniref:biotin--[acetyl-CoA-carboxylase] ligase n=1 Tax=Lacticaseibacillus daqingensis TaxID=2486014 RepID=UPI000F78159B|nr:biotin--[acetyl-CoA-carboxylase] ligase [Lacticaseibacillus daqingensis]